MNSYLKRPDLIIYLKADTDTLLSRIKKRDRDYESSIDPEYIHTLNISYDRWVESLSDQPVMIIETDYFNIFQDSKAFNDIQKDILKRL